MQSSEKLVAETSRCPGCRGERWALLFSGEDRRLGVNRESFHLVCCKECALVYMNPQPSDERIAGFYPPEYWWAADTSHLGGRLLLRLRQMLWWDVFSLVKKHCPKGGSILDVGCSSGVFLDWARRSGFEASGIEQSPTAVRWAREKLGLSVIEGKLEDIPQDRKYDCISLFHVLEHVPRPAHTLSLLKDVLSADGCLILEVPNLDSWGRTLFKDRWWGWDIPRHLTHFTPDTLSRLLQQADFEIIEMRLFSLRNSPALLGGSLLEAWKPSVAGGHSRSWMLPGFRAVLHLVGLPVALLETFFGTGEVLLTVARRRRV